MEGLYLGLGTIGLAFFVLGGIFLIYGLRRTRPIRNWEKTSGTIIQKEENLVITLGKILRNESFSQDIPDRYPTVEYEVNGQTYTNTSKISQQPGLKPGRIVEVLYNSNHPEQAVINTFVQRGSLFTLLGSIFLTLACIFLTMILIVYFLY